MANGVGANLMSLGLSQKKDAFNALGQSAEQETRRNSENKQLETQRVQGNQQLASSVGGLAGGAIAGAEYGSAAGPWGTLIGGLVGAVAGRLF